MKEQINKLIDELASKELTFGCVVQHPFHPNETLVFFRVRRNEGVKGVDFRGGEVLKEPKTKYTDVFLKQNGGIFYCNLFDGKKYKIIGHDIYLHTVLQKMKDMVEIYYVKDVIGVLELWEACGFNKSLNQIIEDSGWEEKLGFHDELEGWVNGYQRLKNPQAQALCDYLITIFKV